MKVETTKNENVLALSVHYHYLCAFNYNCQL